MKKVIIPILLAALLGGCFGGARPDNDSQPATEESTKAKTSDPRECAQNFTFDGNFVRGRTFKTNAFAKGVTQSQAVKRAVRYLTTVGWQINSVNDSLGIISASQTVSYGNGKTVPLNVSIEEVKGGVRVDVTYVISGGLSSPVEAVRKEFCAVVGSVEGK